MQFSRASAMALALLLVSCTAGRVQADSPVDSGALVAADRASVARPGASQLDLLRGMPPEILARLAGGGRPAASGRVGHNRDAWRGAQYQRGAALGLLAAASRGDRAAAEEAWRAVDEAFAHQASDGGFDARNESGTPAAMKDVYSDIAFWLAQFVQAALVLEASPLAPAFHDRLESLRPRVALAARKLAEGKATLMAREVSATNRYFIDALAYGLSGLWLGDRQLVTAAGDFVALGLSKQRPEGFFDEKGGADTSYNCVSILMLEVYGVYFPDPSHEASVARAASWELDRVRSDGEIDASGNARTGLGQETYFGKTKEINYSEATLALLYYGLRHQDSRALDAANRVFVHARRAP